VFRGLFAQVFKVQIIKNITLFVSFLGYNHSIILSTSATNNIAAELSSISPILTEVSDYPDTNQDKLNEKGNTIGNIISGWDDAVYNDILYTVLFDFESNDYALYKSNLDGSNEIKIYTGEIHRINIVDNWIYYLDTYDKGALYKMRLDGTDITKLYNDGIRYPNIIGELVYYSLFPYKGLYKIKTDGTRKTLLHDSVCSSIMVTDDWIYFTTDGFKLHKIKTDGSQLTKLNDDATYYPNVYGDWIYYATKNGFYKIKIDGTQKTKLHDDELRYTNIDDDWIYFTNFTGDSGLYKMRLDGSDITKLDDGDRSGRVISISIIGDWIRYSKDIVEDYEVYQIRKDGTEKKLIRPGIYSPWQNNITETQNN